jgi:hypothetical protein
MKKSYRVTELAGEFVAGLRNPGPGKTVELTAKQAEYPLRNKEIELPSSAARPARARKPAVETLPETPADPVPEA